jgi:two-component system, chemotaxis family, protein-glutamate methylesterase/glutaminase
MMNKLKILVVEDSLTARRRLVEVLEEDPNFEVVAEAEDGAQAIEQCLRHRPHAVTMDMMLPVMSGLAATEYIMAHCPTPILIVSSAANRGEVFKTYDALAAGAVDVVEKPIGNEPAGLWEAQFRSALRIVARVRVITHPRARLGNLRSDRRAISELEPPPLRTGTPALAVLAMGASTGGPNALVTVLDSLPRDLSVPILAVMHINALFAGALADWMDAQVSRTVSFAKGGELVNTLSNQVILAPPDQHLLVRGGRLVLTAERERHSCRPSVDVLFESIALEYGAAAAACLLTGMGRDGALGLLALRQAGAATIAQDESSCVVYGMPREAALLGAAERVLPLAQIGPALAGLARQVSRDSGAP